MPVLWNMTLTDTENREEFQNNSGPHSDEVNDHLSDDESNSEESFINSVEISVPKVAVPEKIILCIDISLDEDVSGYLVKNSTEPCLSQKLVLKEALALFLMNKVSLHQDTEFALVVVKPGVVEWAAGFTNDFQEIVSFVNNLDYCTTEDLQNYDLTPVFQKICENVTLPVEDCPIIVPPSELYHVIVIYNSSKYIPKVDLFDHSYKKLIASPYFVLDMLYLHEKQSKDNNCQIIFNNLAGMCKNTSYIFEASRSVTKVFNNFAKLLPHPFQRVHLGELR